MRFKRNDSVMLRSGGLIFKVENTEGRKTICVLKIRRSRESKGYKTMYHIVRYAIPTRLLKLVKQLSKRQVRQLLRSA